MNLILRSCFLFFLYMFVIFLPLVCFFLFINFLVLCWLLPANVVGYVCKVLDIR